MLSDEISTRTPSMERRELGMLTLQLRQAVSEAEAAEAESAADAIDMEAARQQMAAKIEPMLAARRAAMDEELAAARAAADTTVAKARRAAAVMAAQAARTAEPEPELEAVTEREVAAEVEHVAELEAEAEVEAELEPEVEVEVEHIAEAEAELEPEVEQVAELEPKPEWMIVTVPTVAPALPTDDPWAVWARPNDDVAAADGLEPEVEPLVAPVEPHITVVNTPNIVLDAEAFARVFATVLAEARAGQPTVPPEYLAALQAQAQLIAPAAQKAPVKKGFWANAKHLDVLLLGLGAAIVLGILAAWLV